MQTETIKQRVAVDMCHAPDLPCPGMADCGKKSRCVQRFSYQVGSPRPSDLRQSITKPLLSLQMLLSLSTSTPSKEEETVQCPSIRAFRFPSGCVCHAEVVGGEERPDLSEHHHHSFQ